jgi:Na+/melibiose symporter-like transporter
VHRGRGDVFLCFLWGKERVPLSLADNFTLREQLAGLRKNDQLLMMQVMTFLLVNILCIRGVIKKPDDEVSCAIRQSV